MPSVAPEARHQRARRFRYRHGRGLPRPHLHAMVVVGRGPRALHRRRQAALHRVGGGRRRIGRRGQPRRTGADVHEDRGAGVVARAEERFPVAARIVDGRQAQLSGQLRERDRVDAALRVAADLVGRQPRIPQGNDLQGHQAAVGVAGPLLDRPVVVGLHARERELLVGPLGEELSAEPRVGGEAQRRLDVVHVHVGDARLRFVTALSHLIERDRAHPPLVLAIAGARVQHLVAPREVLVDPPVGLGSVAALARDLISLDPLDRVRVAHDARSLLAPLRRQPPLPQVRRLDDVVVDRDDPGDRSGDRWGVGLGRLAHRGSPSR